LDEGAGVGETKLVAQSSKAAERGFRREVEKELMGKEEEPSELIYFKVYESQIPVIEQAIETAARMLGTDKFSRLLSGDDLC
jgi:hypothetical protein